MICGKRGERVTAGGQTNDTQTQGHTDEAGVGVCGCVCPCVCVHLYFPA